MTPADSGKNRRQTLSVTVFRAEGAVAAIQNGADRVVLRPEVFAAQQAGIDIIGYARARGADTLLDLTQLMRDSELAERAAMLDTLYRQGLGGVIVSEPGALRMAKMTAPGCLHYWGAPVCGAADVRFAAAQECAGVTLSSFLDRDELSALLDIPDIRADIPVMGPLCPGGGRVACLLGRDGAYTPCGFACRELYGHSGKADSNILTTRDLCLLAHLPDFSRAEALSVTPTDASPEAAALLTALARRAMDGDIPDKSAVQAVFAALGRPSPTDSPYTGQGDIFTADGKPAATSARLLESARESYTGAERQLVPVRFYALLQQGAPIRLGADDYEGHTVYASGPVPERTTGAALREAEVNTQWYKTSGTFYRCEEARTRLDPGLHVPTIVLAELRRSALAALTEARCALPERPSGGYHAGMKYLPRADKPLINVLVSRLSQITGDLLDLSPARLYVPAAEAAANPEKASELVQKSFPVAVLPRMCDDAELPGLTERLTALYALGFREALAHSGGQIALAASLGFSVRMDSFVMNTQALKAYKSMGVVSCTLSPAISLEKIRAMSHVTDTELIGYGRLPLMLAQRCLIKPKSGLCSCENINELTDVRGQHMPLVRECGHRTMIYGARKLWLHGLEKHWRRIGLWAVRLDFTTENPRECVQVTESYTTGGRYVPNAHTTGMYMTEN